MHRLRFALFVLALSGAAAAPAQPGEWRKRDAHHPRAERSAAPAHWRSPMDPEERRRLREDLVAPPVRGADPADAEARRREIRRLREEVRSGRLTHEEAMREYRERYGGHPGAHRGRLTREEREQLRRDVLEANRDLERR